MPGEYTVEIEDREAGTYRRENGLPLGEAEALLDEYGIDWSRLQPGPHGTLETEGAWGRYHVTVSDN